MKVAFIISVYQNDKLHFFKQAIESLVNQNYGFDNISIYLGIDGAISTHISEYITDHHSFFYKVIVNKQNKGLAFTLNCLIEALGDERYIFRMDSDDIAKTDRVTKQIAFMQQHPEIEISGGAIEEIDSSGKAQMTRIYPKSTKIAKRFIPKASIFAHPTVCFRKSFFNKGYRYKTKYKFNQDIILWYEALACGIEVGNINDVVLQLRMTEEFYKRRGRKMALGEFLVNCNGIKALYGYHWKMLYPFARLLIRLMPSMPSRLIKLIYSEKI